MCVNALTGSGLLIAQLLYTILVLVGMVVIIQHTVLQNNSIITDRIIVGLHNRFKKKVNYLCQLYNYFKIILLTRHFRKLFTLFLLVLHTVTQTERKRIHN